MSLKYVFLLTHLAVACAGNAQEQSVVAPAPSTSTETSPPTAMPPPAPSALSPVVPEAPAPSPEVVVEPAEPLHPPPGVLWPQPGGWTPPRCAFEATAKVTRRGEWFRVSAVLRNLTAKRLEFDLADRCPQGFAQFSGLPEGYDYYDRCAAEAGTCAGPPRLGLHVSLPPGQSVRLAEIDIYPGQSRCNAQLPVGRYKLGFSLPPQLHVCEKPGKIQINALSKPLVYAPTVGCPPPKPCF